PTDSFQRDICRLARSIADRLIGLALSSGAAKGLSHIGVIQVLEENGIDIDVVAGSSMGAYVGAIWNSGHNGQQLEAIAREMESRWALWTLIDPAFPPRQGFIHGYAVKRRLQKSIGHVRFSELVRTLHVIVTNLATLERVVFSSGEVADAVHASVAVPGVCVPVSLGGETYVDGGIVDPLPVDVLRALGVGRVIAVNAIPTPDRIKYCLQAEQELAQLTKKRTREIVRKLIPVDEHWNYFARGNILDILMRSIHGAQIIMSESLSRQADIVLRPRVCDDRWVDFRSPGRFIAAGREIAERHLPEIKALVEKKTAQNELALGTLARLA
ncbi:MAG TPA: patatin-like phospholipase family protein, partial [Verrucomicrobiae bacterium]|nr:patatin-like phospholipase family protein [Verrucomicrobiae bacterium]